MPALVTKRKINKNNIKPEVVGGGLRCVLPNIL